jgi:sugar lactone lactonase YvrE
MQGGVVARRVVLAVAGLLAVAGCTRSNPAYKGRVVGHDAKAPDGANPNAADVGQAGTDGASRVDAGPAANDGPATGDAAAAARCGSLTANVEGIANADGLVVDDDGTIYFLTDDSTHSYVGRILPGTAPVAKWVRVDNSPVTWGLAIDRARGRLYVAVVSGAGAIIRFDNITSATPTGKAVVSGVTNPNDVVVADDGTVYYDNQGDRHIYSVSVTGQGPNRVTTTPLGSTTAQQAPAGLAVAPDGALIVGLEHGGRLYRITLADAKETSRDFYGTWTGWANALTFDRRGRLYISIYDDTAPRNVVRLEGDGSVTSLLSGGRYSSLTFGRGVLDCRDLYVAEPFGPMHRLHVEDAN